MCEKIEDKFFTKDNKFLFGSTPTLVDYVFYQELLSAMILSGQGTATEFLTDDPQIRHTKLKNITAWYSEISAVKECKIQADEFINSMNVSRPSSRSSRQSGRGGGSSRRQKEKRVTFAPNKQVKFSTEQEENE